MEFKIHKRTTIVWDIIAYEDCVVGHLVKAPAGGRFLLDSENRPLLHLPFRDVKIALEWFAVYMKK